MRRREERPSGWVDSVGKGTGAGRLESLPRYAEYCPRTKHRHRLVTAFNLVAHTLRLALLFPFYR